MLELRFIQFGFYWLKLSFDVVFEKPFGLKAKQLSITERKMKVRDNKNSQSDIFQSCFFIFHLDRKRKEVV